MPCARGRAFSRCQLAAETSNGGEIKYGLEADCVGGILIGE
jgi:hypothetical protein